MVLTFKNFNNNKGKCKVKNKDGDIDKRTVWQISYIRKDLPDYSLYE